MLYTSVFNPRLLLEGEQFHVPSHSDSLLQRGAVLLVVSMAEFLGEKCFSEARHFLNPTNATITEGCLFHQNTGWALALPGSIRHSGR